MMVMNRTEQSRGQFNIDGTENKAHRLVPEGKERCLKLGQRAERESNLLRRQFASELCPSIPPPLFMPFVPPFCHRTLYSRHSNSIPYLTHPYSIQLSRNLYWSTNTLHTYAVGGTHTQLYTSFAYEQAIHCWLPLSRVYKPPGSPRHGFLFFLSLFSLSSLSSFNCYILCPLVYTYIPLTYLPLYKLQPLSSLLTIIPFSLSLISPLTPLV